MSVDRFFWVSFVFRSWMDPARASVLVRNLRSRRFLLHPTKFGPVWESFIGSVSDFCDIFFLSLNVADRCEANFLKNYLPAILPLHPSVSFVSVSPLPRYHIRKRLWFSCSFDFWQDSKNTAFRTSRMRWTEVDSSFVGFPDSLIQFSISIPNWKKVLGAWYIVKLFY